MKILATADLHGRLPEIGPCDVLILAGDICPDFPNKAAKYTLPDKGGSLQAVWLDTTFREWLEPIAARCTVLAIWGNHDFVGERPALVPELPWTLLQDSGVKINGLVFWGTPWVPGLPRWAFYASETALKARAAMIPSDVDVLVSHGPPRGYLDAVGEMSKRGNVRPMEVGDLALRDELDRIGPRFLICGHIHESRGTCRRLECVIHNVAHLDDLYEDPKPPTELIIATHTAEVPIAAWG